MQICKTTVIAFLLNCLCLSAYANDTVKTGTTAKAGEETYPEVEYALWAYAPTEYFQRIGEYFDGPELTANKLIVRSDPAQRGGLYFILQMNENATVYPKDASIVLQYIVPSSPWPKRKSFSIPENMRNEHEWWIGITGTDAPLKFIKHYVPKVNMRSGVLRYGNEYSPVAWKFEIVNTDGKVLTEYHSFLWSMPANAALNNEIADASSHGD